MATKSGLWERGRRSGRGSGVGGVPTHENVFPVEDARRLEALLAESQVEVETWRLRDGGPLLDS